MKFKHLIIVALLLAIITMGAASASEDIASDDDLAVSDEGDAVDVSQDEELGEMDEDDVFIDVEDIEETDTSSNFTTIEVSERDGNFVICTGEGENTYELYRENLAESDRYTQDEGAYYFGVSLGDVNNYIDQKDPGKNFFDFVQSGQELRFVFEYLDQDFVEESFTVEFSDGEIIFNEEIDYQLVCVDEFDINDADAVVLSLICPDDATGKFLVKIYRNVNDVSKWINDADYPIDGSDYGNQINFTVGKLGITQKGEYSFKIYHLSDDEDEPNEGNQIDWLEAEAIDSTEFRITDTWNEADVNALAENIHVFGLYCPDGHEGIVVVTVRLDGDVVATNSKNINEKNEENIIYWYISELNLTYVDCKYSINVNVNEGEFEDTWNIWFNSPVSVSDEAYVGAIENNRRILVHVNVPSDIDEGRIVIEVDGEVVFNRTLSDFEDIEETNNESSVYFKHHPHYGPGPGDVRFYVYNVCNDVIENVEAKTYNLTATFILNEHRLFSYNGNVTLKESNVEENDGVRIEMNDAESYEIGSDYADIACISVPEGADGRVVVTSDGDTLFEGNLDELDNDGGNIFTLYPNNLDINESGRYEITVAYWEDGKMVVNNTATYNFYEDDEEDDSEDGVVIYVPDGEDKEYDLDSEDDLDTPFAFVSVRNDLNGKIVFLVWVGEEGDEQEFFGKNLGDITNKDDDEGFTIYKISLSDLGNYNDLIECGSFKLAFIDEEDNEIDSRVYDIDVDDEGIVKFWENDDDEDEIHGYGDKIEADFTDANILDNGVVVTIAKDQIPYDVDNEFTVIMPREDDETRNVTLKLDELEEGDNYVIRVNHLQLPEFKELYDILMILQFYTEGEEAYYAEYMDDDEPITIYESPCIFNEISILGEDDVITIQEIPEDVDEFTITISKEGSEDIVKTFKFSELVDELDDVWVAFKLNDLGITETGDYKITVKYSDDLTYSGNLTVTKNVDIRTHEEDDYGDLKTFESVDELVVNFRISESVTGYVKLYVNNAQVGENINLADLRMGSHPPDDGRQIILNDLNITESGEYTVKVELYSAADELLGEKEFNILVNVSESSVKINEEAYPYGTEANDEVIEYTIGAPLGEGQYFNIYFNGVKAGVITAEGLEFYEEFTVQMFDVLLFKPGNYDVNVTFFDGENETDVTTGSFSINELTLTSDKDVYIFDEDSIIISFNMDSVADKDRLDAYYVYDWGPVGRDDDMIFNPYGGNQLKEDGMYEDGVISFDVAWITDEHDNVHYRLDVGTTLIYVVYKNATGRYGGFIEVNVTERPEPPELFVMWSNYPDWDKVEYSLDDPYMIHIYPNSDDSDFSNITITVKIGDEIYLNATLADLNLQPLINDHDETYYTIGPVHFTKDIDPGHYDNVIAYYDSTNYHVTSTDRDMPDYVNLFGDSSVTFSNDIEYTCGESGTTTITLVGATVSLENISVEGAVADISLDGDVITISGLNGGDYTLKVITTPINEYYRSVEGTANIKVNKINPTLAVTIDDLNYNDTVIVVHSNVDGDYNITIGEFSANFTVFADQGEVTIPVLAASDDKYVATVVFKGSGIYNIATATAEFKVNKITPVVNVAIGDADVTSTALEIIADIDGDYNITIGDFHADFTVSGGQASVPIDPLPASDDKYVATIVFKGNENYTENTTTAEFYVNKLTADLTVAIADVNINSTELEITANIDGNYSISFGNFSANFTVSGGKATVPIDSLPANEKITATVVYKGNATYDEATVTAEFKVNGEDSKANVTIPEIEAGKATTVPIKLASDATGTVQAIVDGKVVASATLVNGEAVLEIPALTAGEHTISIAYSGDSKYQAFTKDSKVTVKEASKTSETTPIVTKQATKIVAKKKVIFKAKKKVKKFTITLKTKKGKAVKKVWVTLKIKGKKIIKAKTNNKGKATFKIKKLTKKGKYSATIKFKGNSNYNAATKKVKIIVKK